MRPRGVSAACVLCLLLSPAPRAAERPVESGPASREIVVEGRYLNLPVKKGAPKHKMRYVVDDRTVREFEIELADGEPDFWVFDDISEFKGKKLRMEVDDVRPNFKGLAAVEAGDAIKGGGDLYQEKHRPQFHFTSRRGWLNDPNGLVYSDGEYHLFYQHNPYGWDWGNMHWGHAVSADLVHWKELPTALYPRRFGDWCFSGSAVVDADDTSGFRDDRGGETPPLLVAAYTSTGRGECVAFSNDRGRTWTDYPDDPVVKHAGRDPRLLWHEPTKRWVMAVYDEKDGKRWIAFYTSPDLKKWEYQSRIEGFYECPDLFELPVEGGGEEMGAVLRRRQVRRRRFRRQDVHAGRKREEAALVRQLLRGPDLQQHARRPPHPDRLGQRRHVSRHAVQPADGVSLPADAAQDGRRPAACSPSRLQEVESLHAKKHAVADRTLKPGDNPLADVSGDLFDIRAEFEPGDAEAFGFTVRGVPVIYDVKKQEISCRNVTAPLKPEDGKVRLQLLVDRGSIEIYGERRPRRPVGRRDPGGRQPCRWKCSAAAGRRGCGRWRRSR